MSTDGSQRPLLPYGQTATMDSSAAGAAVPIGESLSTSAPSLNRSSLSEPRKLYLRRWLMLAIFCAMSGLLNLLVFAFVPVTTDVLHYYDPQETGAVSIDAIFLLCAVTLITAIPLFLAGPLIMVKIPLSVAMWALCGLNAVGAVIRFAFCAPTLGGYVSNFIGQFLISLGQLVTWAGPTRMSAVWFPEKERAIATSLSAMFNLVGIAVAYLTSPALLPTPADRTHALLRTWMIVALVVTAVSVLLFRAKPPTPPSDSVIDGPEQVAGYTYKQAFKETWKNRSFVAISIVFGIGFGLFNGLFTVLEPLFQAYNYSPAESSIFAVVMIFAGVGGAVVAGAIVDKTKRYKQVLLGAIGLSLGALLWLVFSLHPSNHGSITGAMAALGVTALSLTPVCLELSVEHTYPVPELYSSGFLMAFCNVIALIVVFVMSALVASSPAGTIWFAFGLFFVAAAAAVWMGTDYRRVRADGASQSGLSIATLN